MRHLATQRMFIEPRQERSIHTEPVALDPAQLLLLGIERALAPPIVHMRNSLQPMRVVIVGSGLASSNISIDEGEADFEFGLPHALPQTAAMPVGAHSQFHQRVVHGEVLVDEEGKIYERIGRRIRAIRQLASGAHGELIELVPVVHPNLRLLGPSTSPKIVEQHDSLDAVAVSPANSHEDQSTGTSRFIPLQATEQTAKECGYRKLFADPGQWRIVSWADFKEVLAKQLSHPDRLKDTYRLPCYVQVIEVERSITIEQLAASVDKAHTRDKGLYFLTAEIAAKLDILSLLPPLTVSSGHRPPNTLVQNDRLFRLVVANDPTADVAASKLSSNAVAEKPQLKRAIPDRFSKDREFSISREEALYDIKADASFVARLCRLIAKVLLLKRRREIRKWQVMLSGKSVEEQLWSTRPPKHGLSDRNIRDWAQQLLVTAGYDPDSMLLEWEIFWRRRGLV